MNTVVDQIRFHYNTVSFYFPDRTRLKRFLQEILTGEGRKIEAINYIFCTDEYLLQINRQYLQHDTLTDIITFELSLEGCPLIADIFISIDRVRENAQIFNVSFQEELHRVIFHGILHLAGYKDKKTAEKDLMRQKETACLQNYARFT